MADASQTVYFMPNAVNRVSELISAERNATDLHLRIAVQGGGCSGFQYAFTFGYALADDDKIIESQDTGGKSVKLVIDMFSYVYLEGSEVDYVEDAQGEHFIVRNPRAKTTCGCGSSFSVED